ncbi:MAG: hypothetical protein V3T53_02925 [Phycisphaerales bacterium]
MTQHSIDLLPDQIRARSRAGVVAGWYVVAIMAVVVLLAVTATHARFRLSHAREQLNVAEQRASLVIAGESQASALRAQLLETRHFIERYERTALPLDMSQVLATVVNDLPVNVTLDRIDLAAGVRHTGRSARSRGAGDETGPRPRVLTGELRGFAATDADIAEIVARMESRALYERVSLDFSRTRIVRERGAREFRISFLIDLDVPYRVVEAPQPQAGEVVDAD